MVAELLYRKLHNVPDLSLIDTFYVGDNWVDRYVDKGADSLQGKRVAYHLFALDDAGLQSENPSKTVGTFARASAPESVQEMRIDKDAKGILLSWQKPTAAVLGYQLFRKRDDGPLRLLATPAVELNNYKDTDVELGVRYTYRMRVRYATGRFSTMSEEISIRF